MYIKVFSFEFALRLKGSCFVSIMWMVVSRFCLGVIIVFFIIGRAKDWESFRVGDFI